MATFFIVLLTIISILSAIFLIGIILLQQNKAGGGLGAMSGWTESTFGASADNVLMKGTTWAASIFLVSTLFLAAVTGRWRTAGKSIIEKNDLPAASAVTAPAKTEEAKPAEAPKADETKAAEAPKAEETKAAEAPKTDETKPAEAPKPAENAPAEEKK